MLLLPPIARETELQTAIELLDRGETIYVNRAIARPKHLPLEVVWCAEPDRSGMRRVRRKTESELRTDALFERHGFTRAENSLCAACG